MASRPWELAGLISLSLVLTSCMGAKTPDRPSESVSNVPLTEHISNETKFTSKDFGVKGSPRITSVKRPRKGGGRYQIGKPYKVKGKWYRPKEDKHLKQVGMASWYGPNFHGRLTANGEIYDQYGLSAAHPTMPLPSYARVTNLENGRRVTVRVNDRGPYAHGRVIDLSAKAATLLGYRKRGVAKVKVEYLGKARMDGLDERKLLASYRGPKVGDPFAPQTSSPGTMIAMADIAPQSKPEQAINAGFNGSSVTLSSTIPVPVSRPTLFEGIPLYANADNSEQVVYNPILPASGTKTRLNANPPRPLAFQEDELDIDQLSFQFNPTENGFFDPDNHRIVTIKIGLLPSKEGQNLLQTLVRDVAELLISDKGMVRLKTRENMANQLLGYVKEIGFNKAMIQ